MRGSFRDSPMTCSFFALIPKNAKQKIGIDIDAYTDAKISTDVPDAHSSNANGIFLFNTRQAKVPVSCFYPKLRRHALWEKTDA